MNIVRTMNRIKTDGKYMTPNYIFSRVVSKITGNNRIKFNLKTMDGLIYGDGNTAMFSTFKEVYIENNYETDLENVKYILDLGANIGLASKYLSNRYPNAIVFAVEPFEENFEFLSKNITNNVMPIKKAIWSKVTTLGLEKDICTPSNKINDSVKGNYLTTTISEIMKENHIKEFDIVKIDIEGAEKEILLNNNDWLNKTNYLMMEYHYKDRDKEENMLKKVGFKEVKVTNGIHHYRRDLK